MRIRIFAAFSALFLGLSTVAAVSPSGAADAPVAPTFVPVSPARLMDTRGDGTTTDGGSAKLGPLLKGQTRTLPVAGRGGVAATSIAAVVLNVTAAEATAGTFLTVFPTGTARPTASNLNVAPGGSVANLVTAAVNADGMVDIYNELGSVQVIADVVGYFPRGTPLTSFAPKRFLDTRVGAGFTTVDNLGTGSGPVAEGKHLDLTIAGRSGIPTTGVGAVVMNVTATLATKTTFITAYPAGEPRPNASNLNVTTGDTPNLVVVKVGTNGKVSLYNDKGSVHLVADVVGWFPSGSTAFTAVSPARLLETRTGAGLTTIDGVHQGSGRIGAGPTKVLSVKVTGRAGIPTTGVGAVIVNLTGIAATNDTFITVYPSGESLPATSNLNFRANTNRPNLAIAKVGGDGRINLYNSAGTTDLVIDVVGWFPGVTPTGPIKSWGCPELDTANCATLPARVLPTVAVEGLTSANAPVAIATGTNHSLALLTDGAVVAWGANGSGQLGNGTTSASAVPVMVSTLGPGSGVAALAAGGGVSVALKANGSVLTWGLAGLTPQAVTFPGSTSVTVAVFAGANAAGAIQEDGSLWGWQNNEKVATQVATIGVRSIARGADHVVILMTDGGVWTFGKNNRGQLGDGTLNDRTNTATSGFARVTGLGAGSTVKEVAAGGNSSYARKADGSIVAWGDNTFGQLGGGVPSATQVTTPMATAIVTGSNVVQIVAGDRHAVVRKADGSVFAWGDNSKGQLGNTSVATVSVAPVAVTGFGAGSGVKALAASNLHTLALT